MDRRRDADVRADRRLWRTEDGRLVEDGDADGRTLAYPAGDEISAADQAKVPGAQEPEPEEPKQAAKPANKARRPAANKETS